MEFIWDLPVSPSQGGEIINWNLIKMFLIIDTSNKIAQIILSEDAKVIDSVSFHCVGTLTTELLPKIEKLLKKHKQTLENIEAIGAVIGPGSFTGLRVGVTTANAIGYALGKPLIKISNSKFQMTNKSQISNDQKLAELVCKKWRKGQVEKILLPEYGNKIF